MPFASGSTRRASRWGSSSASSGDPYSVEALDRQISNARLRAEDAGYRSDPDKRNWFERATNLPEGQNAFLDTLELLGRPGQAVLNVIDKAATGQRGVGESAWRGFAGYDRVRGADIIESRGITDPTAKAILGTVTELATDPLNAVPAGAIAKGIGFAGRNAARGVSASYKALEGAAPSLRTLRENKIQPALERTRDALGTMFNRDYKIDETLDGGKSTFLKDRASQAENTRRFMQEESVKNIADSARRTGGIDTGTDVGRIMEAPLRQFEDVQMYEFPDGIRRTTSKRELKNEVIGNQQRVKELGGQVREVRRGLDTQITNTARQLDKLDRSIQRMFFSAENKKLKSLQKTDPKSLKSAKVVRGFAPSSPALNVLMKRSGEIQEQIDNMRSELGLPKIRKNSYTPEEMQKLATQRAFNQLSPSPAFNVLLKQRDELKTQLDELRTVRSTAGNQEVTEIQKLVDDTDAVREAAKNPMIVQREIARPQRELSSTPEIQNAARTLVKSNNELRQYALDNGIQIPEIEGYMTHVWSKAERELRKNNRLSTIDAGRRGSGNPNKKVIAARELTGSAEDINERLGRDMFEPNAYFATAIGQKRLIDYISAVKFRKEVLDNSDFARKYVKGMNVPPNAEVIDTANYTFLKDADDTLDGVAKPEQIGGKYIVTKAAKRALDRFQKLNTDDGTKAFIKAFDTATSVWKRFALFSFGYHARNAIGALFNNYVGGMNLYNGDLVKYTTQGIREVANAVRGKESPLFREYRQQGLGSSALSQVEFMTHADPEKAIEKTIKERSKDLKGQVTSRINPLRAFETSREAGDLIDQTNRFAAYKWAREKLKLSPEQAADKVREMQFDYTKLSPFEQNIMVRVIPFYRWMRNNIPYQIKQFIHDPKKYAAVNKIRLNAQDAYGIEEEETPEWMKQQFAIPVSDDKFLAMALPLGDLTKLSEPGKMVVDSLNTLVKTPIELVTNRNFFYNKDIQKFDGQEKQFEVPGTGIEWGIPIKFSYLLEQSTGQIGRGFSQYLQKPEDVDQDTKFRMPTLGINSLLKPYDVEEAQRFERLDELRKLQDHLRYIEQQSGAKPRTVREIQAGQ